MVKITASNNYSLRGKVMPKKFRVTFEYENSTKFIELSHKDINNEYDAEIGFWERMDDAGVSEVEILDIEEV